ncbi:MAG: hypothetical protein HYY60_00625 [Parcubacteria group bacterium]|nr:hypothetical protein [Parcubacteria group bacterium]
MFQFLNLNLCQIQNSKPVPYRPASCGAGSGFQIPNLSRTEPKVLVRDSKFQLLKGVDTNKDQSYFLWTLTQDHLKYCLFPIGDYTKPAVRAMARKFGLPNAERRDSQGVCFIGQFPMKEFLKKYIPAEKGDVLATQAQKRLTPERWASFPASRGREGRATLLWRRRHILRICLETKK